MLMEKNKKYFAKLNANVIANCLMCFFNYEDLSQVNKVNKKFHQGINGLCIEPLILKYCSSFTSKYSSLSNMVFFPPSFIDEINTKINLIDSEHLIALTKKGISHIIEVNLYQSSKLDYSYDYLSSDYSSASFSISYIPPMKYKVYIKHNLFYLSSQSKKIILRVNESLAFESIYPSVAMDEEFDEFINEQVDKTGDCSFMQNRMVSFLTVLDIPKFNYRQNNIVTFFIIGGVDKVRIESLILEPY